MKCPSFELSKQLAEAGFSAPSHMGYMWSGNDHQLLVYNGSMFPNEVDAKDILAYDLETLLDALPNSYEPKNDGGELYFQFGKYGMGYVCCDGDEHEESIQAVVMPQDKSFADTAARLLLELHQKGFVTFTNN